MGIAEFVAAAVVIEGIVSYVTTIVKNKKIEWKIILAIVLGCVISFNLNLDIFNLIGMSEANPMVGIILTGILISRGSNYVFEIYERLTNWKNKESMN